MQVLCVCEEGQQLQDTIKWEVFPEYEGAVEIFASSTPDIFNLNSPILTANIADHVVLVPRLSDSRKYFMLSFDKKEQIYVTNRKLNIPGVFNLRDIGGYQNEDGETIKWGKVYRSGSLAEITKNGKDRLDRLNINTLVDLRTTEEKASDKSKLKFNNVISIPMSQPFDDAMKDRLMEGKCRRNDAIIFMQDLFSSYTTDYQTQLTKLFNTLSKRESYPVLIECGTGNNRTGFIVALIMSALQMPEEEIIDDYLFSNSCVDLAKIAEFGQDLHPDQQEALTMLMSAQKNFLQYSFEKIRQDNNSVEDYFSKKLNFNCKKREKLRELLLTH
ncbi:MAG: tyrosine-protein phosphatase [Bacteroidales bacterium]